MESHTVSGMQDQRDDSLKMQLLGSAVYLTHGRVCFRVFKASEPDAVRRCRTALVKRREAPLRSGENSDKQFCPVSSRKPLSQRTHGNHDTPTLSV